MPQLDFPSYTIQEASQRGDDLFELYFKDWGLGGEIQWPDFGDPGVSISLAGVAIGPKSTVDRAWISFNLNKNAPDITGGEPSSSLFTNRVRPVSVDSPLIFGQPTNPSKTSTFTDPTLTMVKYGALYVYAQDVVPGLSTPQPIYSALVNSTVYNSYLDVNGVLRTISTSTCGPLLHLYLYLKAPNIAIPTKRAPMTYGRKFAPPAGGEQLLASIPTFGRNAVHVSLRADQLITSYRIGALRVSDSQNSSYDQFEQPVDSAANVNAGTPVVMTPCISTGGLKADYLNIYVTLFVPNTIVDLAVSATD
jgi:hypothetical protein